MTSPTPRLRKLGFIAVLGTGFGLLGSAAGGIVGLQSPLQNAAAIQQQQERVLELRHVDCPQPLPPRPGGEREEDL